MPKKKKNQNNPSSLEELAKKILVNSQKAFYFGANNKGSTPSSCQQAVFIEEKINSLANNDNLFERRLKKISIKDLKKIKNLRQAYIDHKKIEFGLELLSFFYDSPSLKKQYEAEIENKRKNIKWNDGWLDDLNLILTTAYLEQYREKHNRDIFSIEDTRTYDKLRNEGVSDKNNERKIYFKRTFFDLKAATLHGTGACELMAEFALFEAVRMSKNLDCSIHYIRFLSSEYQEIPYQEINAIALGDWPNDDCLIVCPWLEDNENLIWKKDLQNTLFSNYSVIKTIFKIVPGAEMDQLREMLAKCNFLPDIEEKRTIRSRTEELSKEYQKAFKNFLIKENDAEINMTRRLGR
ncbi:hypothetical protein [Rickettsiella endosymbiont of Rhagonycha lignosa]|uniref:hypothetical protein n=1 Tax=Rickettsiella endosymbiont of Rhagonycha lignosa TaxID=3077937 RepID=UPI00313ECAF0